MAGEALKRLCNIAICAILFFLPPHLHMSEKSSTFLYPQGVRSATLCNVQGHLTYHDNSPV